MALPELFRGNLVAPVLGAPMFLVSFPPLVTAQCKAGIAAAFPHVNARPSEQLDQWLTDINRELDAFREANPGAPVGPLGVNLVSHRTNPRFEPDLALVEKHRVPFVITSLGHPGKVVEVVHGYGGVVLSDIINAAHARKAADAGVDGLVCVGAGAGGHASTQSQFSLVRAVREFYDGMLVLGGAINDGWQVRAAEMLGADLAYVGTRFIATQESNAQPEYKQMIVDSDVEDLVYTDRLSGIGCNFLRPSLAANGIDPDTLPPKRVDLAELAGDTKLWKDIWTAGHGVATIHEVPTVQEVVERLAREYREACRLPASAALQAV